MKNARMGRLDGLLSGLNKALFLLSSPMNLVGDLSLCKGLTRMNNGFPTTTFGNDIKRKPRRVLAARRVRGSVVY